MSAILRYHMGKEISPTASPNGLVAWELAVGARVSPPEYLDDSGQPQSSKFSRCVRKVESLHFC